MKFALIGQDIPMLLPTLLADLLFAGNEGADTAVYENNPAMQGVLQGYMDAIYQKRGLGGRALVSEDLPQVLEEADCVIYAGDCMPASRFRMDRDALAGPSEEDPGLPRPGACKRRPRRADARPAGRQQGSRPVRGNDLCLPRRPGDEPGPAHGAHLRGICGRGLPLLWPGAHAPAGGQRPGGSVPRPAPQARHGHGSGHRGPAGASPLRFPCGTPPPAPTCSPRRRKSPARATWAAWPGAGCIGTGRCPWARSPTTRSSCLPSRTSSPRRNPTFGESVEQRKERILHMNTIASKGADSREGMMAQLVLLFEGPGPAARAAGPGAFAGDGPAHGRGHPAQPRRVATAGKPCYHRGRTDPARRGGCVPRPPGPRGIGGHFAGGGRNQPPGGPRRCRRPRRAPGSH